MEVRVLFGMLGIVVLLLALGTPGAFAQDEGNEEEEATRLARFGIHKLKRTTTTYISTVTFTTSAFFTCTKIKNCGHHDPEKEEGEVFFRADFFPLDAANGRASLTITAPPEGGFQTLQSSEEVETKLIINTGTEEIEKARAAAASLSAQERQEKILTVNKHFATTSIVSYTTTSTNFDQTVSVIYNGCPPPDALVVPAC